MVAISVPAFLPICLSIGTIYSVNRLKEQRLFCINPARISVSGRVSCMVFDKTGTLTEDDLEIFGFNGCERRGNLIFLS